MTGYVEGAMHKYQHKNTTRPQHVWEQPVLHYNKVMVIYPYPFLVVLTQFFPWIIFINGCICILTGPPG